jgi:hypothetical protein
MKIVEKQSSKALFSEEYNFIFNKKDGFFMRWGETEYDDPQYSPYGPEILDLEISTGECNGRCKFCSPDGTLINTPHGKIPIEQIKKEDFVLGYDIKNEKITVNEVHEVYSRDYDGDLICFELDNKTVLKLTPDHIVILKSGVEKEAKDINMDDEIIFF